MANSLLTMVNAAIINGFEVDDMLDSWVLKK